MRILWITEFFANNPGEITGGVETRCFYVRKYLWDLGHSVEVIARERGEWDVVSWQSVPARIAFLIRAFFAGLNCDFDLVEGSNVLVFPLAWLLGTLKRRPVVFWYPDVYLGRWREVGGSVGYFLELWERLVLRLPGVRFIAISQTTRDKLVKRGTSADRVTVIYCGYEPKEIETVGLTNKKYDVCAVSRLVSYKRLTDLSQATVKLGLKTVIVGQGPEAKILEGVPGVRLLGHIARHEAVLKVMKSARIFCHPSVVEGFGIVVIEAMALGIPVVVADIPVMREITGDGQGALFFKPGDYRDLTAKIGQLLADRKIYQQKAAQARKLVKFYTWARTAEETHRFYLKFKLGT